MVYSDTDCFGSTITASKLQDFCFIYFDQKTIYILIQVPKKNGHCLYFSDLLPRESFTLLFQIQFLVFYLFSLNSKCSKGFVFFFFKFLLPSFYSLFMFSREYRQLNNTSFICASFLLSMMPQKKMEEIIDIGQGAKG